MPRIGKYEIPTRDLDDCVNLLRKAHQTSQEYLLQRDKFAQAMGLSAKGGGTNMAISSMEKYSLIETGGGQIKYTDLGKKLIYGKPNEIVQPREIAVRNVQIFADVFDKFGANFTDDQLRVFLIGTAGVDISDADNQTKVVGNLLKKMTPYLSATKSG